MTLQSFYPLALVLHLTGLTLLAGTTLIDYVVFRKFWKRFRSAPGEGLAILQVQALFQPFIIAGLLLLILSGVAMMGLTRGVFGEQVWFRVKFGLLLVIVANGILVGRRLAARLRRLAKEEGGLLQVAGMRRPLAWFHAVQLTCFAVIIVLSVFKFN